MAVNFLNTAWPDWSAEARISANLANDHDMLSVVNINAADLVGRRFNGYDLVPYLAENGINSSLQVFWDKQSDAAFVDWLFPYPQRMRITQWLYWAERRLSTHARFHPHSWFLPSSKSFRSADVIHYQIVHAGFLALGALPYLTRRKPSVWTWHDPWPMTGHCIYSLDCERWMTGCGQCPDLSLDFAMRRDRTAEEFERKRRIYPGIKADIVVASPWMLKRARRSPLGETFNFHMIPFGIDLENFRPRDQAAARDRLGVLPGRKVLLIRASISPFKGLADFRAALSGLQTTQPLCIISFQETGQFEHFIGEHQIIECGWSNDEDRLIDAYAACDMFIMPSRAEAFGLMAVEAMACARPVVSYEGTSLPSVTFAPEAGMTAPLGDTAALRQVIEHLLSNEEECIRRGERSRELAEQHYDIRRQAALLADLYRGVAERFHGRAGARQ